MRRYLLDTGIAQDFINRRHGVHERVDAERRAGNCIGICTPVLGGLWAGVEGSVSKERNLRRLRLGLSRLIVWPYTNDAAAEFGRVFAELRRLGPPMQQVDIMVAAVAFTLRQCTVVTRDADLMAVPGLAVEDWASVGPPEASPDRAGPGDPTAGRPDEIERRPGPPAWAEFSIGSFPRLPRRQRDFGKFLSRL